MINKNLFWGMDNLGTFHAGIKSNVGYFQTGEQKEPQPMETAKQEEKHSPPQNEHDEIEIEVEVQEEDILEREPAIEREHTAQHGPTGEEETEGYDPAEELEKARKTWSAERPEERMCQNITRTGKAKQENREESGKEKEVHQNEIKGRHQLNRVYDVLPLHFPVIDYIADKKYNPCPEFNRGLCQANHPHKDEEDPEGKP